MPLRGRRIHPQMSAGLVLMLGVLCDTSFGGAFGRGRPGIAPDPAFAVVPDPEASAFAVEPSGTAAAVALPALPVPDLAHPVPRPVAPIVTLAPIAVHAVGAARPAAVLAASPPLLVTVSFPDRPGARAKADEVALMLRANGMPVAEIEGGRPLVRARVLFAFDEDRAEAAIIGRSLAAAYGVQSPMDLAPSSMTARRPGMIEVMLPG